MKNAYTAEETIRLSRAYNARIKSLRALACELEEALDEDWDEGLARELGEIIDELADWNRD